MLDHLLPLWVALESRLRAEKGQGELGQTVIEYALILAFVAAVAVVLGTNGAIRGKVGNAFNAVGNLLP